MKDAFIYTQKSLSLTKNKGKGYTEEDHDNLMLICSFEGTKLGLTASAGTTPLQQFIWYLLWK